MRKSPSTPTTMQNLLRYFHLSWASQSRVASAEKHVCARGTALWTCIRDLVCKGKVGQRVGPGSHVEVEGWVPCHPDVCPPAYLDLGLLLCGFCQSSFKDF
jgi:hypothetical protein